jgi:hypothetical protein
MPSKEKAKQKCTLQIGEWAGSRRSTALWSQDQLLLGSVDMGRGGESGKTGVCAINFQRRVMSHQFLP